jgi:hypothetical protein
MFERTKKGWKSVIGVVGTRFLKMVLLLLIWAPIIAMASSQPLVPVVEVEESIYTTPLANNGAGLTWDFSSTNLVRVGDRVFASGIETMPGVAPLNNVQATLWHREGTSWSRVWKDTDRQREPCPLVALPGLQKILLYSNPTLTALDTYDGPAKPVLFEFSTTDPNRTPETNHPEWEGSPPFKSNSYRSFAADGASGETILFQNFNMDHAEWTFLDQQGLWPAKGKLMFPTDGSPAKPVRVAFPNVGLKNRALHFVGVSDIIETNADWYNWKVQHDVTFLYVFRRLYYTWSPDITQGDFHPWIEIANREHYAGTTLPGDLWIAPNGDIHLVWTEQALDPTLRPTFFPSAKQRYEINYAILHDGQVLFRRTLVAADEGTPDPIPINPRFHVTPDNRLFVFFYAQAPVFENRMLEILPGGKITPAIRVPLKTPFASRYFTATPRGGSETSDTLDLLGSKGVPVGEENAFYARIRLTNVALPMPENPINYFSSPMEWRSPGNFLGWLKGPTGDFNGDGKADVSLYYRDSFSWRTWVGLSAGDGKFNGVRWQTDGDYSTYAANELSGDFNGDGIVDICLYSADSSGWKTQVALSGGHGTFSSPIAWQYSGDFSGSTIGLGDFNGDNNTDMVLSKPDSTGWSTLVALGDGHGNFQNPVSWQSQGNFSGGWVSGFGDFNGDNKMDAMVHYNDSTSVRAWVALGKGDGTFEGRYPWSYIGDFSNLSFNLADIDGDNKTDVILSRNDALGWIAWVARASTGKFLDPIRWFYPGNFSDAIGGVFTINLMDVDGDHKTDMVLSRNDSQGWYAWMARASGVPGMFEEPIAWSSSSDFSNDQWQPGFGDVDGNGKNDLLLLRGDENGWWITTALVDATAPTIALTAPAANSTFTTPQMVEITANASDNANVSKVWFTLNGVTVSTDTTAPYAYAWPITSTNNGAYSWSATAFDAMGNSSTTVVVPVTVNIDGTPPLAPASLTAPDISSTSLRLVWSPATDNVAVAGYHVQRGTSTIATLNSDVTSYSDTGLLPKTEYRYTVSAFDASGNESAPSAERIVTTPHPPLIAPSGSIFNITNHSAEVRWTLVQDAKRYTVAASLSKEGGSFPVQQEATGRANMLSGLTPNTTYYVFLNACDETQCTEPALVDSVVTLADVPGLSVASVSAGTVQLTIDPKRNPAGTFYQVEISHGGGPFTLGPTGTTLSPVVGGLTPGDRYSFRVFAQNHQGIKTAVSIEKEATLPPSTVDGARGYPSPFRPGDGATGIMFDRIPPETAVRIFTMDGQRVKTLTTDGDGRVQWDLTNEDGNSVASGVYLVLVEKNGVRKKLKVMLQK